MAKKKDDGSWSLHSFSEILRQQGEENERNRQDYFARFKAEMPAQIAALRTKGNPELLELFLEFSGYRSDPREYEMRQEFNQHVQAEILARMMPFRLPRVGKRSTSH